MTLVLCEVVLRAETKDWRPRFGPFGQNSYTPCGLDVLCSVVSSPTESGIGGVGNKRVISKPSYQYQRLDGEACIFCR